MILSDKIAYEIAERLLKIKAIKIQPHEPFTWASGWRSPIYCDNRVTLSHPAIRTFIKNNLIDLIKKHFPAANVIAGVATAGIAQGALVADAMNLPFAYVRPEPKKHGTGRQVEGEVKGGQKTVLIEDLISTGKSSLAALQPLEDEGCEILGVAATFSYGFDAAAENFKKNNCVFHILSNYEHLLKAALDMNYIKPDELETLIEWRKNPAAWNPEFTK